MTVTYTLVTGVAHTDLAERAIPYADLPHRHDVETIDGQRYLVAGREIDREAGTARAYVTRIGAERVPDHGPLFEGAPS